MDYNDYELIYYVSENSEEANELLIEKYTPLIKSIASKYNAYTISGGIDSSDLFQEGLIGLNNAIKSYDETNAKFYTFAKVCIERQMISMIRSVNRQKNNILNTSYSLDKVLDSQDSDFYNTINASSEIDALDNIIYEENYEEIKRIADETLSDFENKVFNMKLEHFTYDEIAIALNTSKKAIDNAMQRIKSKLKDKISALELTKM